MEISSKELKTSVLDFIPAYILAVFLVSTYVSILGATGTISIPRIDLLISSFSGLLVNAIPISILILAVAHGLTRYTRSFNWLVAGIGTGLILHGLTIVLWSMQGASGPEIGIYSAIFGTGLKLPIALGITGQLIQMLDIGEKTVRRFSL
jgi:hypothetical protein